MPTIVFRPQNKYSPGILALAFDDLRFMILPQIPSRQQHNVPGLHIHNRSRIAAGVGFITPNKFHSAPGLSPVRRPFQHQINVACIPTIIFTAFGKCQQSAIRSNKQSWNAKTLVASITWLENGLGFKRLGGAVEGENYSQDDEEDFFHNWELF
jgi:hypothetical protein